LRREPRQAFIISAKLRKDEIQDTNNGLGIIKEKEAFSL